MKPNSTWYANSQRIRILMMSVISGHVQSGRSKLDNWGADIHIYVFTHHKNNRFQFSKEINNCAEHEYMNISLPNYQACYGPDNILVFNGIFKTFECIVWYADFQVWAQVRLNFNIP